MATDAQINANRQNARKSTGPKTEEGKASSSRNALKNGFYSREFLVRDDEREDFERLRAGLLAEIQPNTNIIFGLFFQLLHAEWNLHRIRRIEAGYFLQSENPYADEKLSPQLETIARHRMRFERTRTSVFKQIQDQLTNRAFAMESDSVPLTAHQQANHALLHRSFRRSEGAEEILPSVDALLSRLKHQSHPQNEPRTASMN